MKTPTSQKIFVSVGSGFLVACTAAVVHLSTMPVERSLLVHELNGDFPMCLAVQRTGDADANRVANDAVDKINIALRDAISDALAQNVSYVDSSTAEPMERKIAA